MCVPQAIVFGLALGIVGAVPPALLFERALRGARNLLAQAPSVAAGLVSIGMSFVLLILPVAIVRVLAPNYVVPFGSAEAASFLLVWAVEGWRAWHDAQQGAAPGERNCGESTRETPRGDRRACR